MTYKKEGEKNQDGKDVKNMQKTLKKYQDTYAKFNKNIQECKAEQKRLDEEIQAIKTGVKDNAKKGKLSSLLRGTETDRLAKLLASKQIIDIEVEAIEEANKNNDNEVVKRALEFLNAVEEENDKESKIYEQKRQEAQRMIDEGKKMAAKYSIMSCITASNIRVNQARYELNGVLDHRMTNEEKSEFARGSSSIQKLKDILSR